MRWTEKEQPKLGDKRVISKFLFSSKLIGSEWRWLEFVKINQEYKEWPATYHHHHYTQTGWKDISWASNHSHGDCY